MRKRKCSIKKSRKCWERIKGITQNFDSLDVSLVDRLTGLKYSYEDKIKKVKLIDEKLRNLLEPKEYEVACKKMFKREDFFF